MQRQRITIVNKLGLHARAAAKLVKIASGFSCDIQLRRSDQVTNSVNAKSIMGVLMLAAAQGVELEISANGEDADAALAALTALIERRFDEQQ